MRHSSPIAAALLLACGPLPCKHPVVRGSATSTSEPPAEGTYFAAYARGDWIMVAGTEGHVLRAEIVERDGYIPVGVRYDDKVVDTGTTETIRGLSYVPAGDMYAVGDGGTVRISPDEGMTWRSSESGTVADLHAVAFAAVGDHLTTVIVGDGVALRSLDAGASWIPSALPTGREALRDVIAVPSGGWLAVGLGGVILRSTGDAVAWEVDPSPTRSDLRRIRAEENENPIYLSGGEVVLVGSPGEWSPIDVPFTGGVADAWPFTLLMQDGRMAHRDNYPKNQPYAPVNPDEPLPSYIRIVDESRSDSTAVLLADDGQLVFVEFVIVEQYTDSECRPLD